MRYKPKNTSIKVVILVIAIAAVIIVNAAGLSTTRSATRIGYTGKEGWRNWTGSYVYLDGTMRKTLHPKTVPGVYHIAVETQAGSISIELLDADGNVIFSQTDIETGEFDVEVSGRIVAKITAKGHRGSFSITCA